MIGSYRDRNGSPVSGINADISYRHGQLDSNSTMKYERDNGMWDKEPRELIKKPDLTVKLNIIPGKIIDSKPLIKFGLTKNVKLKKPWEI
jgi:hypothetical protein